MSEKTHSERLADAERDMRFSGVSTGGLYVHYKIRQTYPDVTVYEVVAMCVREADLVPCVVYRNLGEGRVWCRPLDEFCGSVTVDGRDIPRFQLATVRDRLPRPE